MLFITEGRYCQKGCPKDTELKVIDHPGWSYKGVRHNSFPNRFAVISEEGAFFGHHPRFIPWGEQSDTACLTAFHHSEASVFALEQMEVAS